MGDGTDDPTFDFDDLADELEDFATRLSRPSNYICLSITLDRELELENLSDFDAPRGLQVPSLTDDTPRWTYEDHEFEVGQGYRDAARLGWPIIGIYDRFSVSHLQQMLDDALENAEYLG